ncbi:hypothetical protein [Paenibacillus lautus]|uniref:hypothetical protein n=1 Tax=Paenibacillus lautus TaxID=1401 RepID=UPI002DBC413C|nr:hypothetical protein [Paenibacillus lautus]MEC0253624.1 hypothetical protein [Paenibacillus lautus]
MTTVRISSAPTVENRYADAVLIVRTAPNVQAIGLQRGYERRQTLPESIRVITVTGWPLRH